MRLRDRIRPGVRVLFVGINPGVRSAETGHHFAGYSNRFWKLLFEAGIIPEPATSADDDRLQDLGFGFTNLIARPTPGIDTLTPAEYVAGWKILERKIEKYEPAVVAMVGVTVWRAVVPLLDVPDEERSVLKRSKCPGLQPATVHGARIHVLPNPSGRNANYSYEEMLDAYRQLRSAAGAG